MVLLNMAYLTFVFMHGICHILHRLYLVDV